MCLPVIGGIVSGIGAAMGAANSAKNEKMQAAMARRQEQIDREASSFKAKRQQDQVDRTLGASRAAYAANGVAIDSGSAADVIGESAAEGDLDVRAIRWNSQLNSDNQLFKAKMHDVNAKSAKASIGIAFMTPVIGSLAKMGESFGAAS